MTYALAYMSALMLAPIAIAGAWALMLERVTARADLTTRGWTVAGSSLITALAVFALTMLTLPAPYPG